jgi:poly(3-hydroxyalkanoate) depolymerase
MINGIGCNIEMWSPLRNRLAALTTIAFDVPGSGESPASRVPLRIKALARLCVQVLDQVGFSDADVFGFSFGGMIAQQLAHDHPSRVRRLILAATTPGIGGVPGRPEAISALLTVRRFYDAEYLVRIAPRVYAGRASRDTAFLAEQHAARAARPPTQFGYLSQFSAMMGWSSLGWLHRLRQPTLVLAGAEDPVTPAGNAGILAAAIPDSRVHILRDGGHLFPLDSAIDVAPLVLDWLK